MIYLSIIKTEAEDFENIIDLFNSEKEVNVTKSAFVESASYILSISFGTQILDNELENQLYLPDGIMLRKKEAVLTTLVLQSCDKPWLGTEPVSEIVQKTFECSN